MTVPLVAALVWSDVQAQILRPNDPRELMTVAPTDANVPRIAAELRRRDERARAAGRAAHDRGRSERRVGVAVVVVPARPVRRLPRHGGADRSPRARDVLIVTEGSRRLLAGRLRDYRGRPFVMRSRRPPMGTGFTPGGFVRWFVHRTPWVTVTPEREWLYERRTSTRPPAP